MSILNSVLGSLGRITIGSLFVSGHIFEEPAQILIDEGAEMTLVNPEIVNQIPACMRPVIMETIYSCTGIGGVSLNIQGQIELIIEIGGAKVVHTALVCANLVEKNIGLLLGNDFTKLNDLYIRSKYMKAYSQNQEVPM